MRHSGSSDTTAESTCNLKVRVLQVPNLLPLTFYTRNMTISYQRISAGAHLSVISGTAFSTLSTVAWSAKGLTFLSGKTTARNKVTFLCGGTVRIATAACLNTCNKWVSLKPRWTNTDGSVKVYLTLGSGTTNGSQTRVHTLLGFASFVQWTVIVYLTFIYKSEKQKGEIPVLCLPSSKTYIDNTRCEGLQPSHWDSDTLACEMWSGIEHSFHKDHPKCMDLSIGFLCKLCCQDSLCHIDTLLGKLHKNRKLSTIPLDS